MALVSSERTFTIENIKKIRHYHLAYLMLALTLILPFFLFKRAGPNYAFFAELTSAICASLFIFFASLSIKNFVIYNRVSVYLVVFASYLVFDLIINPPVYPSLHWLYIGSILLCSLLASTLTNFAREQGIEKVFSVVCYGLMIGGLLQDIVIFLQMLHKDWLYGWIFYINEGGAYSGNIGQRNMTAHYLSWGILATAYLIYVKKLLKPLGWSLVIAQALFLGATNSRTLLVYMIAIIILLIVTSIWQKQISKTLLKIVGITVLLVLAFQAITLPMLTTLQDWSSTGTTSIGRLSNSEGMTIRLVEWYKAWLIFLEHPWFGSGWGSYSYQSFLLSSDPKFASMPHGTQIFSHSHNLLLNLLAEVGIIGTCIIVGGLIWSITSLKVQAWGPIAFISTLILMISLIHSFFEFPLWYGYFFLVFVISISLCTASLASKKAVHKCKILNVGSWSVAFIALLSICASLNLYIEYQNLTKLSSNFIEDKNVIDKLNTSDEMLLIGREQPLLKAYASMQAVNYVRGIVADKLPTYYDTLLSESAYYFPSPTNGINYLMTLCNDSGDWNDSEWQYYSALKTYFPAAIPSASVLLSMSNQCDKAYQKVSQECYEYFSEKDQSPNCNLNESVIKNAHN